MICEKCQAEEFRTHKGFCINCLWQIVTPVGVEQFKTCANCRIVKPVDLFKTGDSTCILCRKLISLGFRYSYRLGISKRSIFSGNFATCKTCQDMVSVDEMPDNSYDCRSCSNKRFFNEVVKVGGMFDDYQSCINCNDSLLISAFPTGRLVCRRCINKNNSKGLYRP